MEADHRDQVFELSQQFGNWFEDTDRRLAEANWRIDSLEISLAAATFLFQHLSSGFKRFVTLHAIEL